MNFEKQAKTNENKTWSDLILIWFDLNSDSILLMLFKIEKRERKNRDSDRSSIGYCLQYVQPTNTNIGTNWCKIIAVGKLKNKRQRTLGEINETFFFLFIWVALMRCVMVVMVMAISPVFMAGALVKFGYFREKKNQIEHRPLNHKNCRYEIHNHHHHHHLWVTLNTGCSRVCHSG